jgi:Domain of unknown function (DUF4878)
LLRQGFLYPRQDCPHALGRRGLAGAVGRRGAARARRGYALPRMPANSPAIAARSAGALLVAVLLAAGLGACGGAVTTGNFKGEAHAVAQRLSDLQSDVTAADEQKVCDSDFSRAARARLSTRGNTCSEALKRQIGSIDAYELTVEKVAVSGASATATVRSTWSGKVRTTAVKLVKEDGSWRVATVE